ncbi:hypothetical protein I6J18_10515 [Peribacillus psychrosaccharolyticus]|uniref:Uncharacterized protein n=1 Tax=Peribacillus psychrosaccharolyticus TaxID=1407 RepID=A0A974S213_PERPY|nr:hypothetical protein [Peribacillus psychrosaccharolyticus]MEC2057754.1 hypothetical protein [Peribacillus psychrosaccharolyticus]MED3744716.1 hypothetical protein [Peribacillus psychrosaccharolyticus]QQT02232.1 hypothetical protein I6J18_10515 [Peribacillus psychrosaccharolyticus]
MNEKIVNENEGESTIIKESTSNLESGYYVKEMQKGFGMKSSRTPFVYKLTFPEPERVFS